MVCRACGKESAGEFSFCPYCGMALVAGPPVIESPDALQEVKPLKAVATKEPTPTAGVATDRSNKIGTYVFGAFSVIALLVSLIKGIVPIYLVEAAVWAGAAWFWHRTKTHSELAKAIVIVFAALVAIGELIQIASQPDFRSKHIPPAIPEYAYNPPTGKYPAITGDTQDKANSGEAHLKSEPKPRKETHTGLARIIREG
jgi:hypothetical protein